MSRMTQLLTFGLFAALSVSGVNARADNDADLGGVNKAMNDFYKGARDSKDKSPAALQQLKQQTIEPAVQSKIEAARKSMSNPTSPGGNGSGGRSRYSSSSDDSSSSAPEAQSGPIMDAKDVPAELEFPGAPKVLPSSKPAAQKH